METGCVLMTDMQTPSLQNGSPQKSGYEWCGVFWIDGKNNKKILRFFFSSYQEKFNENWGDEVKKNDHNSKNKNLKNLKYDFSFYSADSACFMWILTLLKKKKKIVNFFFQNYFEFFSMVSLAVCGVDPSCWNEILDT